MMMLRPVLDPDPVLRVVWSGVKAHDEAVAQQRQASPRIAPVVFQHRRRGQLRTVLRLIQRTPGGVTMAEVMRLCDLNAKQASGILCRLCNEGDAGRRYAKWRGEGARLRPQIYLAAAQNTVDGAQGEA